MLRLDHIVKEYTMKDSSVQALKGITLNFRKNEFVSILGPSGCGKTTMLNILGGLDQYTSGDLIIEGKSTKDFNDHDWDIYRNHRIGFVFQSYNLIPHENILENVELALTIGGVSKVEREEKAKKALDKVGLKGMYKKMPNQLSGGQCQRVAIARALVNEPEILLADEPTGALDSVTSVQIMDLIKEISKDRLVIMVTHNPDLAYRYSTRIVKLLDGTLQDDSNPYTVEEEMQERDGNNEITSEKEHARLENEKAKMSWWTAFKLSSKNLWSKAKRTFLTIVAASIGIVGVSAVLSIRSGVTGYIDDMQDEMLSGNPISVSRSSMDLSSMMGSVSVGEQKTIVRNAMKDGKINIDFVTKQLIDSAKTMGSAMIQNEITQEYVDFVKDMPKDYYEDIVFKYGIDVTNNIYTSETRDDPTIEDSSTTQKTETMSLSAIRSLATEILNQKLNESGYGAYASVIEGYSGTFAQSINNVDYLLQQYDLLPGGKVATEEDEIMVVLDSNDALTDFLLTLLGYYSQEDFLSVVYHYNDVNGEDSHKNEDTERRFQDIQNLDAKKLMEKKFTYYPNNTILKRHTKETPLDYKFFDYSYLEDPSWNDGIQLKIVGVLTPKEGRQYTTLSSGFYYTPKFTQKFIEDNNESEFTKFVRDEEVEVSGSKIKSKGSLSSMEVNMVTNIKMGVYYDFDYKLEGKVYKDKTAFLGSSDSSLSGLMKILLGGSSTTTSKEKTISSRQVGGEKLPFSIQFFPKSFESKYLVTDYLDQWNADKDKDVTFGNVTAPKNRADIKYTDNLAVVISMVNNIINIVSISLIAFTALSLVVSTVMIAIITYVSVMERIKEIGIIRALGGRKKDVSHLFNAETFIIGFLSGVFGIAITYILQGILNIIIHANFPMISMIANLPFYFALIVVLISVLLTTIAGFIPARSAAKKDPVVALRSE